MIDERVANGQAIRAHTRAARLERGVAAVAARRVQWRRWAVLLLCWQAVTWAGALVMTWLVGIDVLSFFVIVMGVASFPLFTRVLARPGWLLERQVRAGADVALAIGHLPVPVGRLAEETRVLRLAIEAANPGDPTVEEWVWAWITAVREAGVETREVLARLGLGHEDVEKVLLADELRPSSGKPEESLRARVVAMRAPPDEAVERRRLELIAEHLEAFEVALLRYDPSPYR